jgi:hypothetical protein
MSTDGVFSSDVVDTFCLHSRTMLPTAMAGYSDSNSNVFVNGRNLLSIATYNCRGLNFTKTLYIKSILTSCDVLFIQEHWFSDLQLSQMNQTNLNLLCHVVGGFDNSEVVCGRSHGGCTILWRFDIVARVETITMNSRRVYAVKMSTDSCIYCK